MLSKIVLWSLLIVPWFTLFFLKREILKRYAPVAILAAFLMTIYQIIAYNQKHWIIKVNIIPWLKPILVSGVFGMFIIAAIWVFYFTFGKFWLYLVSNIVMDFMFTVFPIHYLFQEKLGIYQLINITPWARFCIYIFIAIVLYGYQLWQEEIFKSTVKENKNVYGTSSRLKSWIDTKEKVR